MIQYRQLSLFDVMPDAEVDSLIEQLPCRVAKSKRNVFAMLEWLHEQQAKPRKELFNQKEVLYDQNRSHNAGL